MTKLDFSWRVLLLLVVVGVIIAAYTIGAPKDFRVFQELKALIQEVGK